MKLAYVHTGHWPSNSPSTTFVTYNSANLAKYCSQCHLFVKSKRERNPEEVFREYFNTEKPQTLIIHQFKNPLLNSNRFYYRKVFKKLSDIIEGGGLDAVITRRESFLPLLVKLKKKYGIPVYFESHDFFADLSLRNDINWKKKRKQSRFEKKYIGKLDGLICLQNSQKKLYSRLFPETDIRVFRTGIHKYVRSQEKREYMVYIGSIDTHKGVETILQGAMISKNRLKLLIIGGREEKDIQALKKRVQDKYPGLDIEITGWVNKKKLDSLLRRALIGILPLRDTFYNRYITSPLKLFDYFSYGIPVVASDLPSAREIIEEDKTGLFFSADDPRDLANKIDHLIEDKEKLKRMSNYIFASTSHLLWENRASEITGWISNKLK